MIDKTGYALAATLLAATFALASCADGNSADCTDGVDNDADGLVDAADPACIAGGDREAPDPEFPACSDGLDNDEDGLIDFPEDPGCDLGDDPDETNSRVPECRDGVDNDADGLIDYPNDPGCFISAANSEQDDCPSGAQCPACANGVDDDEDGLIDYGPSASNDPGCDRAADDSEFNVAPGVCGLAEVLPLPSDGVATGTIAAGGSNSLISNGCGGSGQEVVYTLMVDEPVSLYVTTAYPETTLDTVVYVRTDCRDTDTEAGCDDDSDGFASKLLVDVDPGVYYIVVDAHDTGSSGNYKLGVFEFIPRGEECDPQAPNCAPGLVCRLLDQNATVETCEPTACADGIDNDGDTDADYPDDPGCTDLDDNDESDTCPGAGCPQCGNEVDDDLDGQTDFPNDPGCNAASDNLERDPCIPGVETLELPDTGVTGTTMGSSNFTGSCDTAAQPEHVYGYTNSRNLLSLTFSTVGSTLDTVTHVREGVCDDSQAEIACYDPTSGGEDVEIDAPTLGETYFVFVDGDFAAGNYVLNVGGVIEGGEACDPALPRFACETGYYCNGTTCAVAACNDNTSNDADGLVDFPNDPGCTDPSDNDEADTCPGAGCPQCGNGTDDDGDGRIDYGTGANADPGCVSASDDNEIDECIPGVPLTLLTDAGAMGTTPPSSDGSDFTPSCHTSTLSTEVEFVYRLQRNLDTLTFSTAGSGSTVLSTRFGDCGSLASELACVNTPSGGETLTLSSPQQGFYYVFVDGDFSSAVSYMLSIRGTIAAGNACNPADTQFTCGSGYACGTGNTCQPSACNDNTDNDGDGLTDEFDPGCTDLNDDDEGDDTCAAMPGTCPQCADGMDNDADGQTDYPADLGCDNAGDALETDCDEETDPLQVFTASPQSGTTVGATNDFTPSCSTSSTAPDRVYSLVVPGILDSLTVDTLTSAYDTVIQVKTPTCDIADYACDDDESTIGGPSEIVLSNVPAGQYLLIVDGWSTNAGAYNLNVSGTIRTGQPCDPAQTFLTCAGATTCTDPGGGFVCN